ncbi:MAG: sugar phosphate nucleotidyltransferase [archaeon]
MQAVILAGGLGTRLRPLTEQIPKPMVEVDGKPFLLHQLRMMHRHGIRDVVLCTGYRSSMVEEFFGDGSGLDMEGLKIRYSVEDEPLGTGGALLLASSLLDDRFILAYGDSYLDMDYEGLWAAHVKGGTTGTMVVYGNEKDTQVVNNVLVDEDSLVKVYDKSGAIPGLGFVEAGVLAFEKKVLESVPGQEDETVRERLSLENEIFPTLIAAGQMRAFITKERFYDIGTFSRLDTFKNSTSSRKNRA